MSGSGEIGSESNSTEQPTECSNIFDEKIFSTVAAVAASSASLSLLACLFIIFIIILFKKWKFFNQRLILYLGVSAAVASLALVLQRVDYQKETSSHYDNFCVFAGFLSQVSGWMLLNAIICIIVTLTVGTLTSRNPEKLELVFVLFIFLFPLTFNWIPFIELAYGKAGAWCWIRSAHEDTCKGFTFGQVLQQVLWYIPLYVTMVILIILYVVVLVKLYRMRRQWTGMYDPTAEKEKKLNQRMARQLLSLIAYPLIFFVLYIPPFISRIHGLFAPNNPEPVLWFISAIFFPLQGGAIAVAFSLDPETRKRLKPANFRAAFSELCSKRKVEEYPVEENLENSVKARA